MLRRSAGLVLGCLLLASCSGQTGATPSGTPTTQTSKSATNAPPVRTPLEQAQLDAGATHVWPLYDVSARGKQVTDLASARFTTRVTEGAIARTDGPAPGVVAAQFTGAGRLVTPVPATDLGPGRPFALEFAFRADDCTRAWSHVMGTGAYDAKGRQGLNVLHYPRDFRTECRVAFEFWTDGAFEGGCATRSAATKGLWQLFVLNYDGADVTCWANGKKFGTVRNAVWKSEAGTPFGIGGAGTGYGGSLDSGSIAAVALYPAPLTHGRIVSHARMLNLPAP